MEDALPQSKLPSWPPRALFAHRGRQGPDNDKNTSGGDSNTDIDTEANEPADMLGTGTASYQKLRDPDSKSKPRWPRSRRIRLALFAFLLFGTVTIILLSTLLTRHGMRGLGSMFKVRLNRHFLFCIRRVGAQANLRNQLTQTVPVHVGQLAMQYATNCRQSKWNCRWYLDFGCYLTGDENRSPLPLDFPSSTTAGRA
jgi:hypothetical protein